MATRVGLEPPTSGSGVRGVKHQATALSGFNCTNSVITQIRGPRGRVGKVAVFQRS